MLTTTYDRKTRTFTAATPEGLVLAGTTREQVESAYLLAVAPKLAQAAARIARAHPQLAERAHRAALIIAGQGVRPGRAPWLPARNRIHNTVWHRWIAQVQGSGFKQDPATARVIGRDWYNVTAIPGGYACECLDHLDGHAPELAQVGRACKHIIAALISQESL